MKHDIRRKSRETDQEEVPLLLKATEGLVSDLKVEHIDSAQEINIGVSFLINLNRCTGMSTKKGSYIGVDLCASIGLAVGALIGGTVKVGASTGVILGLLLGAVLDVLIAIHSKRKPE